MSKFTDSTINQVLVVLRQIMRAVDMYSRRLVKEYNLTAPQLLILQNIKSANQITLGELARRVSLSNATITGIIDRLEKRDLVERIRGQSDRRQIFVTVTKTAEKLLKTAPPLLQDRFVAQFNELKPEERNQMLKVLISVSKMMGAEDIDASPILESQALNGVNKQIDRKPISNLEAEIKRERINE